VYNRLTGAEEASAEDASTQGLINYFRGRHRG
jgi:glucose-6-phosphate isomerase